jgi:hypothetical protein
MIFVIGLPLAKRLYFLLSTFQNDLSLGLNKTPPPPKIGCVQRPRPVEYFLVFLKLGLASFGGPIAHRGYFRDEYMDRRKSSRNRITPTLSRCASSCRTFCWCTACCRCGVGHIPSWPRNPPCATRMLSRSVSWRGLLQSGLDQFHPASRRLCCLQRGWRLPCSDCLASLSSHGKAQCI